MNSEQPRTDPLWPAQIATSLLTTALRGGAGVVATPTPKRPAWLLELYEFEGCPYCRLVREVLTELDLDAMIYPCPKGGERFRPKVAERGGRAQFPYLVDPNTGVEMYESADIIRYLFRTYGPGGGAVPLRWRAAELYGLPSSIAGLPRAGAGIRVRASRAPERPLELYSFEASPYARPVRERLCELELPYVLRSCGRTTVADWAPPGVRRWFGLGVDPETVNRKALAERGGTISIPYLVDGNTGVEMAESARIVRYLDEHYRA